MHAERDLYHTCLRAIVSGGILKCTAFHYYNYIDDLLFDLRMQQNIQQNIQMIKKRRATKNEETATPTIKTGVRSCIWK